MIPRTGMGIGISFKFFRSELELGLRFFLNFRAESELELVRSINQLLIYVIYAIEY